MEGCRLEFTRCDLRDLHLRPPACRDHPIPAKQALKVVDVLPPRSNTNIALPDPQVEEGTCIDALAMHDRSDAPRVWR